MKSGVLIATLFAAPLLLSACASTNADGSAKKPMSSTIGTKVTTNEDGEEIICRRDYATGSRVKYEERCGTQAEWDRLSDANRDGLKDWTGERAVSSE
ncbi:MAG: hypothetical protein CMK07_03685 [Ponticaulis sp.]|nr:hypothetical protein [Ponticaulis sp.]